MSFVDFGFFLGAFFLGGLIIIICCKKKCKTVSPLQESSIVGNRVQQEQLVIREQQVTLVTLVPKYETFEQNPPSYEDSITTQ